MNKQWKLTLGILLVAILVTQPVYASMRYNRISFDWSDESKGPGVAQWMDENGNPATPTHMEQKKTEDPKPMGPGVEDDFAGESYPGELAHKDENQPPDESHLAITPTETIEQEAAAREAEAAKSEAAKAEAAKAEAAKAEAAKAKAESEQSAAHTQSSTRKIDPSKPMIALTFDDGPYAPVGNQIMDCLAKYGGKATFFVVGNRAASYKTELKRMVAEGHEIGNHTQDHKYLNKLSAEQVREQISGCNNSVEAACGVKPTLVRLPGGNKNETVLANVNAPIIMWNIDTEDWKTKNAQKTINAVIGKVKDGDIVLMHEIYKQSGVAAVDIIPKLVSQGYQLVTVSELARHRGGIQAGGVYYHFRP